MTQGFKGARSQAVKGEASSNHGVASPQQLQDIQAPTQPASQVSVTLIFHPAS